MAHRLRTSEFYDTFRKISDDIRNERIRQNVKFRDEIFTSGTHNFSTWSMILGEEVGELDEAMSDILFCKEGATMAHVREEAVQVAAVAAALIERIDFECPYLTAPEKYPCHTRLSGNTKSTETNTFPQPVDLSASKTGSTG